MITILPIFRAMLPLYLNVLLGFCVGKWLKPDHETIVKLLFYVISPLVILHGIWTVQMSGSTLLLPIFTFGVACSLSLFMYSISRNWLSPAMRGVAAFSAGSGATGFYGLPLMTTILPPQLEGLYLMALLGVTVYDNSLGYYMSSHARYSAKECLRQLLSLPHLYAFSIGLILHFLIPTPPELYEQFMVPIKGVYRVFGMMLIGLALASLRSYHIDRAFLALTFLAKFILWPLAVAGLVFLDYYYLHLYSIESYQVLFVLAFVPLAVNTVVIASLADCQPDRIAMVVLLSTLFALLYLPFALTFCLDLCLNL